MVSRKELFGLSNDQAMDVAADISVKICGLLESELKSRDITIADAAKVSMITLAMSTAATADAWATTFGRPELFHSHLKLFSGILGTYVDAVNSGEIDVG